MTLATYHDLYAGAVAVRLVPVGRKGLSNWRAPDRCCVTCGYRNAPAARLVAQAKRDRRFTDIREG